MIILNHDYSEKVQYDDTDYPIYRKYCALSSYPNYTAHSHWHDDIELIAVLFGEMQYNINGKVVTLRQGEGIFVNSRQMHFGFSSAKKECYFLCILLHPMLLCATTAYERDYVLPILNHGNLPFVHLRKDIPWQREIWNKIQLIYDVREETAAQMKTQIAFLSIWTTLYENMPPIEKKIKHMNGDLQIIKNMIGFIQQNYKDKISLSDIAASGVVGQSKCCKLFAKYLRQTPNLYLTQYRLNKSMFLQDVQIKQLRKLPLRLVLATVVIMLKFSKSGLEKVQLNFGKIKNQAKPRENKTPLLGIESYVPSNFCALLYCTGLFQEEKLIPQSTAFSDFQCLIDWVLLDLIFILSILRKKVYRPIRSFYVSVKRSFSCFMVSMGFPDYCVAGFVWLQSERRKRKTAPKEGR